MENLLFSGNPDILMCNMGAITDNTDRPNIRKGQHDTIQIIIFPMILQHEKNPDKMGDCQEGVCLKNPKLEAPFQVKSGFVKKLLIM